ncbi:hypothetical protein SAMN05444008_110192 [Cnuella takakiae]|uniref:Uncharacterized protein n=1 Tax=Cnuella takakiae TaxID=1302690 RepID=A0A1M5DDX7_9BACT|nr:hypothetical protein [Cnuella takakiae]OLY94000.1 hypothetical protein BUE76_20515 [Cnuella takakiae]SHF65199.1 hypothetical protein SAMN05444008_110192 [Cnuella takakiae]
MKRLILIFLLSSVLFVPAMAQDTAGTGKLHIEAKRKLDTARNEKLTSIKTNLLAEVLQASISNGILTSTGSDFTLRSTIYGLKKMFDSDIAIDTNYVRQTFNRNFEIGLGFSLTDAAKINGVNSALTYALVNKRDISLQDEANLGTALAEKKQAINQKVGALVIQLSEVATRVQNAVRSGRLSNTDSIAVMQALTNFGTDKDLEALLTTLNSFGIAAPEGLLQAFTDERAAIDNMVQDLERSISSRSLWTIGAVTNYQDNRWDSILVKTEFLNGLGWEQNADKPWDLYAGAFLNWRQDTLNKQALQRSGLTAKLGLNKVLAVKTDGSSFIEILGAAEYNNLLRGRYPGEERSNLMAAFTVTVRISNSLFLPFNITYDPKGGNVLGFLNVKWDFLRTSPKE